uniref:Uncharacterized protein n=1 Tax=Glossina austeni TaxID=7395 RepID=A0A1A9UUF0_GLOAU
MFIEVKSSKRARHDYQQLNGKQANIMIAKFCRRIETHRQTNYVQKIYKTLTKHSYCVTPPFVTLLCLALLFHLIRLYFTVCVKYALPKTHTTSRNGGLLLQKPQTSTILISCNSMEISKDSFFHNWFTNRQEIVLVIVHSAYILKVKDFLK